MAGTAESV